MNQGKSVNVDAFPARGAKGAQNTKSARGAKGANNAGIYHCKPARGHREKHNGGSIGAGRLL